MKFAKHLARAMEVSDPEWHPFWVNYKHLKKLLKPAVGNTDTLLPAAAAAAAADGPGIPCAAGSGGAEAGTAARTVAAARSEKTAGGTSSGMPLPGNRHHGAPNDDTGTSPGARGLRRPRPWEATAAVAAAATTDTTGVHPLPAVEPDGGDRVKLARFSEEAGATAAKPGKDEAATPHARRRSPGVKIEPAEGRALRSGGGSSGVDGRGEASVPGRTRGCGVRGDCCDDEPVHATVVVGCCRKDPTNAGVGGSASFSVSRCATAAAAAAAAGAAAAAAAAAGRSGNGGRTRAVGSGTVQQYKVAGGVAEWRGQNQPQALRQPEWVRLPGSQQCRCPFFATLLREVDKCRVFFLENEQELKVRTRRLQLALDHIKRPDLSRLSSVKGAHMKLMQACVNFYRDALLLEDFAMLNYTAVIKLLKKRDKLAGTSDQRPFMAEVMAAQPFAMYPGVAKRVVQVEQIFRDIENMCFLRTGEGFKSVMKAELTVVEAIMQLAQESKAAQHKEVGEVTPADSRPPPAPGATRHQHDLERHHQQQNQDHPKGHPHQQQQQQQQQQHRGHDTPSQTKGVRCCEEGTYRDTVTKATGETLAYAREISAMESARAWARASSAASGLAASGGRGGGVGVGGGGVLHATAVSCGSGGIEAGGICPSAAVRPHQSVAASAPGTEAGTKAEAGSEWVLSKHAGRGEAAAKGWGCFRLGFRETEAGARQAAGAGGRERERGGVESAVGSARPVGAGKGRSGRTWRPAMPSTPLAAPTKNPTPTPSSHVSVMLSVRPHIVSAATAADGGGSDGSGGGSGDSGRAGVSQMGTPGAAAAGLPGRVVRSSAVLGPRLVTSAGIIRSDGGGASKQARLG